MYKNKKKWIIGAVIFLSCLIIYLAHWQYFRGLSSGVRFNSEKQLLLTRQIGQDVQHYLEDRQEELYILATFSLINNIKGRIVEPQYRQIKDKLAGKRNIFFLNKDGSFSWLSSNPPDSIKNNNYSWIRDRQRSFFKKSDPDSGIVILKNKQPEQNKLLIFQAVHDITGNKNNILFEILNLQNELKNIISGKLRKGTHIYILDENGQLLYHSQHPEMIYRSVLSGDSLCWDCHQNFDAERQTLAKNSGWMEKKDISGILKLASFVTLGGMSKSWKLVIDSPADEYVRGNREQFWAFFLLSFLMILIVSVGIYLFSSFDKQIRSVEHENKLQKVQLQYTEELIEADEKYRILINQSPDAVLIYQNGKITFANPSFFRLFEYNEADLEKEGFDFKQLTTQEDLEQLRECIRRLVENDDQIARMPLTGLTKIGTALEFELSVGRISVQNKLAYNILLHDITESKQKERALQRQNNLASIGIMSTRIAHEIKNPLASIQTGIRLVETLLPNNDENKSYFQNLVAEVQRVDSIVKSMLSLAREEKLDTKRFDLTNLARRVVDFVKLTLDDQNIEIELNCDQKKVFVTADEAKLEQVLWNVLLNAVEALNDSGKIILQCKQDKNSTSLKIIDDGPGIPPDKLDQVLQPFFSTKSSGNGLGLAISNKIIQSHGGKLEITSSGIQGTTIQITIPEKYT